MKVIDLFDKYFLILMLIYGIVLIFIDSRTLKKAKITGIALIIISTGLFITRAILY